MRKKTLALILALAMCFSLAACGGTAPDGKPSYGKEPAETPENEASWAIYWYLCGSDLETKYGCATMDLMEMMEVELPENVNVVIQTGGAAVWQNDEMDPDKLQRWLYNSEGLELLEEQDTENMGDAQTLSDFLRFADTNYPAEKVAVVFWNHGGGSVGGAAFDELHGLDSLDLEEMYQAFDAVWPADADAPALEMVGFDTCLMATIDVAAVFQNFAKYLVASEELEPGNGWNYTGWLDALAEKPEMDGDDLGIAICSAYYSGCEAAGTEEQATLSVTDLTKLTPLLQAYESFGQEALVSAAKDPAFFAQLGRAAAQSENYGGNTREQGYTNMVDLGHLARQTAWMLPSAQAVSDALEECIVYQVNGVYRAEATGLSCYYSYNGDIRDLNGYINLGTGEAFKHLYAYGLTGEMTKEGMEYLADLNVTEIAEIITLKDKDWDDAPLEVDDEGSAVLNLGPEATEVLAGIGFSLYYIDEENDQMLLLGTDNDLEADWKKGIFRDNFRGVWAAIDGCLVYLELSFEGEDYNLYSVPILLNDEEYNLQVAYDFIEEEWFILGASQGLDASGMASKELRQLEVGDVITTIWMMASYSGDDDFEMYAVEELTVTANTAFSEAPLFDGSYALVFEMWDSFGNYATSEAVFFDCYDGTIITTVY